MSGFATNIDIVNRALQRIGSARITALTDDVKAASESNACYDKLRQAELRRNPWRFAIRKTALRALAMTTKLLTFGAWAIGSTYAVGDIVLGSDGQVYQSSVTANLAHNPTATTGYWTLYFGPDTADAYSATLTYFSGEIALSGGSYYLSLVNSNLASTPPSANWLVLTTQPSAVTLAFLYPIGSGPFADSTSNNVYRLPVGWLCEVPQNPHLPQAQRDWLYESNYLITGDTSPLIYRFVADMLDVTKYDALFCEGLSSRIAFELCEVLTQSITKLGAIGKEYQQFMGEARTRNAIETGPVSPEEDSWLAVKLSAGFSPYQFT